jgi:hypothetical protein
VPLAGNVAAKAKDYATIYREAVAKWQDSLSSAQSVIQLSDQPVFYPIGITGFFFPRIKWLERESHYSPQSSAKVKNSGATPPLPHKQGDQILEIKNRDTH